MPVRMTIKPVSVARQRGAALLLLLMLIGVGVLAVFVTGLNRATQQLERDRITNEALAQAKAALIGYAASVDLSGSKRPGDLPCPDNHPLGDPMEGTPSLSCNISILSLGRLPWKKLGLPDLRDGSGERLWYAVSVNFKNDPRAGTLNSDTSGTITVRDPSGSIINDGTNLTAAIAVVIAPGSVLTRQDGFVQVRGLPGYGVAKNYLDISGGEDNANFVDNDTNGFIQGDIRDVANNVVLNDRLITITPNDLMPVLEKRVAAEALICLRDYAAKPQNKGHYPWAASMGSTLDFNDDSNVLFGRIPDTSTGFLNTKYDSGNVMTDTWTGACKISSTSGWWLNWKEQVFYALADGCKPVNPLPSGCSGPLLTVNPPSPSVNKEVVVFVAGRRLAAVNAGQPRSTPIDKGIVANYLEGQNATPLDNVFERSPITPIFNDVTVYAP